MLAKNLQCSMSRTYCNKEWVQKEYLVSLLKYRHHCRVLGTVGYGLKHLKGTEELLHVTYDVLGVDGWLIQP
ncbi:hypothetical protein C8Q74DRAFT_1274077 [Fomes fomentarius]|nr:hypothetical protein C8Q74DRAFT_1274077 [Fomes fomentarius]